MSIRLAFLVAISCVVAGPTVAGDAVVIGYNYDGAWSAVTYNRSSTPMGGLHYHDSVQACAFAVRDLWSRATDNLARTEIVGQSDRTGYVAVAQGKAKPTTTRSSYWLRGKRRLNLRSCIDIFPMARTQDRVRVPNARANASQ